MSRNLAFPSLKVAQLGELQRVLRSRSTPASLRQRGELIWLLAGGASLAEASEWVGLHYTNAHIWVKRFPEAGVAGLLDHPKSGRPRRYGDDVTTEVIKVAAARPKDLGLKFTTWSLPKLQEYLRENDGGQVFFVSYCLSDGCYRRVNVRGKARYAVESQAEDRHLRCSVKQSP